MNTITLPDELGLTLSKSVQGFDYFSAKSILNQQIILNQNAFSFLIEGTKEVVFGNSSLAIDNSKFILMKSGHCLMTEKTSVSENYRSVVLFFSNEVLLKFIKKLELISEHALKDRSVYSFNNDNFIQGFVRSLQDILKMSESIRSRMLEIKLEEVLLYLTDLYGSGFICEMVVNSDDASQKFTRTVESNQFSRLTVSELAFLCDMSISKFKREFEKYYSESPIKWFQNKRLEYARQLLDQEQKSPSEVYFKVGYENLSSFIQAYKTKYGVTPKQHHKKVDV